MAENALCLRSRPQLSHKITGVGFHRGITAGTTSFESREQHARMDRPCSNGFAGGQAYHRSTGYRQIWQDSLRQKNIFNPRIIFPAERPNQSKRDCHTPLTRCVNEVCQPIKHVKRNHSTLPLNGLFLQQYLSVQAPDTNLKKTFSISTPP